MKALSMHLIGWSLAAAVLASPLDSNAAPPETPHPPASAKSGDSTVPAEAPHPPIPLSVFELPKTPAEGRDPFFPNSTRPFGNLEVAKTNAPPNVDILVLKALAGSRNNRFASINGVDFGEGESREVVTPGGRIRVRCVKIEDDSVVVEVGGVRRTLRLRGGF